MSNSPAIKSIKVTVRGLQTLSLLLSLPLQSQMRADHHELSQGSTGCALQQQHWPPFIIAFAHGDGGVCQRGTHIHRWVQIDAFLGQNIPIKAICH